MSLASSPDARCRRQRITVSMHGKRREGRHMGIKWAAKGAGKAGAKLSAAALRSWLGMQRNRMKVAAVTVCLAALFGWFTAIVPMTCAAFQSFPMVSSSRTGFAQWLAWLQSYFFDSVLTLRAVRSTDWLSTGAFIGYGRVPLRTTSSTRSPQRLSRTSTATPSGCAPRGRSSRN